jgi:hypothetical protein
MRTVRHRRHRSTTVRVTGPDGVTWEGEGDGLAAAVRDLSRKRRRGQCAGSPGETRWRLTAKGETAVAQLRGGRSPHQTAGEGRCG